jgi:hypothetical protein
VCASRFWGSETSRFSDPAARLHPSLCTEGVEWFSVAGSDPSRVREMSVASRGTTFAKQERDRAKKAKAALKRERREARDSAETSPPPVPTVAGEGDVSPEELLRLVKELHDAYADERISLEEFEERKQELMARITV